MVRAHLVLRSSSRIWAGRGPTRTISHSRYGAPTFAISSTSRSNLSLSLDDNHCRVNCGLILSYGLFVVRRATWSYDLMKFGIWGNSVKFFDPLMHSLYLATRTASTLCPYLYSLLLYAEIVIFTCGRVQRPILIRTTTTGWLSRDLVYFDPLPHSLRLGILNRHHPGQTAERSLFGHLRWMTSNFLLRIQIFYCYCLSSATNYFITGSSQLHGEFQTASFLKSIPIIHSMTHKSILFYARSDVFITRRAHSGGIIQPNDLIIYDVEFETVISRCQSAVYTLDPTLHICINSLLSAQM